MTARRTDRWGMTARLATLVLAVLVAGCDGDESGGVIAPTALELAAPPSMRSFGDRSFGVSIENAAGRIARATLGHADGRLEGTVTIRNDADRALLVPRTMFPAVELLPDGAAVVTVAFPLGHTALPTEAVNLDARVAQPLLPGDSLALALTVPLDARPPWVRVHVDYVVAADASGTAPVALGPVPALAPSWPAPMALTAAQLRAAGGTERASCDAIVGGAIAATSVLWPEPGAVRVGVRAGHIYVPTAGAFAGVLDVVNDSDRRLYLLVTATPPQDGTPLAPVTDMSLAGADLTLRIGIPDVPTNPLDRRPLTALPIEPGATQALHVRHNLGTATKRVIVALAWTIFGPTFPDAGDALIQGCPTMAAYRAVYRRLATTAPLKLVD